VTLLSKLALWSIFLCATGLGVFFYLESKNSKKIVDNQVAELQGRVLPETKSIIQILGQIREERQLSENELLLFAEAILDGANPNLIETVLSEMKERASFDPYLLALEGCLLHLQGKTREALIKLEKNLEKYPNHRMSRFHQLRLLWSFGQTDDRIIAKKGLFEMGELDDRWGYRALSSLCFSSRRDGFLIPDVLKAIERLQSHSLVTSLDYIYAAERRLSVEGNLSPKDIFKSLNEVISKPVDPVDLGLWCVAMGMPQEALELSRAHSNGFDIRFFWVQFPSLLETQEIQEARNLRKQANDLLTPADCVRADAYLAMVSDSAFELSEWLKAHGEYKNADALLGLARLALMTQNGKAAYEIFQAAWELDDQSFSISQANQFLQISLTARRTKLAREITSSLLNRFPHKFGNANNYCYLSLLLGIDVEKMEIEAERIANLFPRNPSFLSTLALAKLKVGKTEEALNAMRARGPNSLISGERALLAVILKKFGSSDRAKELALGLQEQRMLPEEWALLIEHGLSNLGG